MRCQNAWFVRCIEREIEKQQGVLLMQHSSQQPDFTHKVPFNCLWIDGWLNPFWVHEELIRRGIHWNISKERSEKGNVHLKGETALVAVLKACAKKKDLDEGSRLYAYILSERLLEKSPNLVTAVINMYVKCGEFTRAQQVLEEVSVGNALSWAVLISAYVQNGKAHEALNCFERMQSEGFSPDAITLSCVLKACAIIGDIDRGRLIHNEIVSRHMLEKDIVLGSALVDMYAKCGMIVKAHQILEVLPVRNVVTWNALIAGYAQKGHLHKAFNCFEQMQTEGLSPNLASFISVLRACASTGAIDKGILIHDELLRNGFLEKSVVLGTALVDMYSKCGLLQKAQKVLDELPVRNAITWSALIAGYAQQGQAQEALDCVDRMRDEGLDPDVFSLTSVVKACGSSGALERGIKIHDEVVSRGLLKKDIWLGTALVDMYAKCGYPVKAQEVLEELPVRNVISWCALIAGYVQQGQCCESLNCYERMQNEGLSPDVVTMTCILKACGITGAIDMGERICEDIVSKGLLKKDIILGSALVDMYAKLGLFAKAQWILEELPVRDVVCWSALIAGYVEKGQDHEALNTYERMQSEGLFPTVLTFIHLLKSCGSMPATAKGNQIHKEIVTRDLLAKDVMLGNALVGMYVKWGDMEKAQEVLEELPMRNSISWSTLIAGYAEQGLCHEALNCLEWMQSEGLSPSVFTFICVLKACGNAGAIDKGKQIHDEVSRKQLLEKDIMLGTTLVDMYAKCGMVVKAQKVLEELTIRDIVSWNALIAGYAQQGQGRQALDCFERMQNEGLSPDEVTFLCVLSACSHSGLLYDAQVLFENMAKKYNITPNLEHHTCMVVIYGCAGRFNDAMSVIEAVKSYDYGVIWLALLGTCRKWGNVELGKVAFNQALQSDSSCTAAYILMANIFAAAGMQEDAEKVEAMRLKYAGWKQGNSMWVDWSGDVHLFCDGDWSHPEIKDICAKMKCMALEMSEEGYFACASWLSQNILDEKKGTRHAHSEMLAIAYALLNTCEGETIHIVNNKRICSNCHDVASIVSKIEKQKIFFRDLEFLHVFEDGFCTCSC